MSQVSIILCSRNRQKVLRETLESMERLEIPDGLSVEAVFVDNGSTDGTPDVMRSFSHGSIPSRVVIEDRPGLSNARNRGVAESTGRVLLFTDDDVRFPVDWVSSMSQPILDGTFDALAGGVRIPEDRMRPWMLPPHRAWMASTDDIDPDNPNRLVGANMAIGRHAFDEVPEFDTELGAGALGYKEETLFTAQIRQAGLRIGSAFDVVVDHHFDHDRLLRSNYLRMARNMGRSDAYVHYHWRHDRPSLAVCFFQIAGRSLQLFWWRTTRRGELTGEGAPLWELSTLRKLHMHLQFMRERQRTPNYSIKGLKKIRRDA